MDENLPDEFWQSYLIALAFTCQNIETGENCEQWQNPGGDIREVCNWREVEEILRKCNRYDEAKSDCKGFFNLAKNLIGDEFDKAGSDFHLTRNRHGAGFWDGDWKAGKELTDIAHTFGSFELIRQENEFDVLT